MKTKALMQTLIDVEHAVQRGELAAAQSLLFEAQEWLLQIEREIIDLRADKGNGYGSSAIRGSWWIVEPEA